MASFKDKDLNKNIELGRNLEKSINEMSKKVY
jgi:hypothetical protein